MIDLDDATKSEENDNESVMDFNDADQPKEHTKEVDREQIRNDLLLRLDSVLAAIFPAGKRRQGKFLVGDVLGSPGDSLEVVLDGEKAGLWTDRATEDGGDIFTLIAANRGIDVHNDFPRVLAAAADILGRPLPVREKRKEAPVDELGPATAKWDYFDDTGKLIAVVYRYDPPGGKKEFRPWDARRRKMSPPDPRPLYNQPGMKDATQVVLVEGEKCAQALIDLGVVATTAMNGANAPVEKTDWTPLAEKEVLIWPDRDKPGWNYATEAGHAVLTAGARSCHILYPPDDAADGWDAADAIAEGFDVAAFLAQGPRMQTQSIDDDDEESVDDDEVAVWGSEDALALIFTRRYYHDWRYVSMWGKWLAWDSYRWRVESTLAAAHLMRGVCRHIAQRTGDPKARVKISSASAVSGVERLARTDRRHACTADEWDTNLWLLNTIGGVIDLRTGRQRPNDRADRMTKVTTATPQGDSPAWRQFLDRVTAGDTELQSYLQRMVGYCLTGITSEHALFFLYGTGANGKSVFINVLATILGDYAANAPMDMFMETRNERHPTELAGLRGARLVTSTETEQGRRWAESKVKHLTGGDPVSARFMHQDFFTYPPQFKLMMAGNHKPSLRSVDEAMRRRLHLIPFTVTIPPEHRDGKLTEKLLKERNGILAWAVKGCLDWQSIGLKPPASVVAATDEYFKAEDALGRWLEERCVLHPNAKVLTAELFNDWKQWAEATGEFIGPLRRFSDLLFNRGIDRWRNNAGARGFIGIDLKEPVSVSHSYYSYGND